MALLPKTRVELRMRVRHGRNAINELMNEDLKPQVPSPLLLAFAPLHRLALGVAVGIVVSALLFLMTLGLVVKGGYPVGPNLALLGQYFFGYTVTFPGAFVGLFWGFVTGFLCGYGFALLRNLCVWLWLTLIRSRAEMDQYGDFLDHM